MTAREARLRSAIAELAEVPPEQLPGEVLDSVLCTAESGQRSLATIGYEAINEHRRTQTPGKGRRLPRSSR